jgi:hypothetical protein
MSHSCGISHHLCVSLLWALSFPNIFGNVVEIQRSGGLIDKAFTLSQHGIRVVHILGPWFF